MTPQQKAILKIMHDIHRDTGRPVPTVAVAVRYGMCPSGTRVYLRQMTAAGIITRIGQRCGYLPLLSA